MAIDSFGKYLKRARRAADLTLEELGARTGIAPSSLSKFEREVSSPSFLAVVGLARELSKPLLYFATGRDRTADDPKELAVHLAYWGVSDLSPSEALIGESRQLEEVIPQVLRIGTARLVEALPALLLKHEFQTAELLAHADRYAVRRRVGWISEIASWVSARVSTNWIAPSAHRRLENVCKAAWERTEDWDVVGRRSSVSPEYAKAEVPPISRRWKVYFPATQERFLQRSSSILRP